MKCPMPECGGQVITLTDFPRVAVCVFNAEHVFKLSLDQALAWPDNKTKQEPWRPRTINELSSEWNLHSDSEVGYAQFRPPLQFGVQERTDDIARMLEEEAEKIGGESEANPWGYGAKLLRRMARRIRSLE